jgi:hypothetical protein
LLLKSRKSRYLNNQFDNEYISELLYPEVLNFSTLSVSLSCSTWQYNEIHVIIGILAVIWAAVLYTSYHDRKPSAGIAFDEMVLGAVQM